MVQPDQERVEHQELDPMIEIHDGCDGTKAIVLLARDLHCSVDDLMPYVRTVHCIGENGQRYVEQMFTPNHPLPEYVSRQEEHADESV